jgi:type 1 glutamine amidotransferase
MRPWIVLTLVVSLIVMCGREGGEEIAMTGTAMTPEEIDQVRQAMPDEPLIRPAKTRRILVFSLSWGYKHESIPWGRTMFRIMAEKTGAFEPVFSDDPAMFEPESLHRFDAVLFNNTNNEIFLPEDYDSLSVAGQNEADRYDALLKKSFAEYLAGGGGLAVIHAGVASFREWPEFGEIIGARFDNHPWITATLKKEDPAHLLVRAFPEDRFEVTDEIYQMKDPWSRERCRVLLSVDTSRTDMTVPGIHRTDGDFAISWIKTYGKGRVFYCALGHQKHIFWDRAVLMHLLDGIQFATGDLSCDVTPVPK